MEQEVKRYGYTHALSALEQRDKKKMMLEREGKEETPREMQIHQDHAESAGKDARSEADRRPEEGEQSCPQPSLEILTILRIDGTTIFT